MRLLHVSDVNGAFQNLVSTLDFASIEGVDVVLASGNFTGDLVSDEDARVLDRIERELFSAARKSGKESFAEALNYFLTDNGVVPELKERAEIYTRFERGLDERARQVYSGLEMLFNDFKGKVLLFQEAEI